MGEKYIFERLFEETFGEWNKGNLRQVGFRILYSLPRVFLLISLLLVLIFVLNESFGWFPDFIESFATEFGKRYNYFEDYHYIVGINSDEKMSEYSFKFYGLSILSLPLFKMDKKNGWSIFFFLLYFFLFLTNVLFLLYVKISHAQIYYL